VSVSSKQGALTKRIISKIVKNVEKELLGVVVRVGMSITVTTF